MLNKRSAGLDGVHGLNANNLDGVGTSAVTGSHIAVALGHGSRHGQVAIFAVHVVGSRPEMIRLNSGLFRILQDLKTSLQDSQKYDQKGLLEILFSVSNFFKAIRRFV